MTGISIKTGSWDTGSHPGRMPCEDEGRDGGDESSTSQDCKQRNQPGKHFDLDF